MLVRCTCVATIKDGTLEVTAFDPECPYVIHQLESVMEMEGF